MIKMASAEKQKDKIILDLSIVDLEGKSLLIERLREEHPLQQDLIHMAKLLKEPQAKPLLSNEN